MMRTFGKLLLLAMLLVGLTTIISHDMFTGARPVVTRPAVTPVVAKTLLPELRHSVYPFSLVPGGVYSVASLRAAMASDPLLAAQFSGFDFTRARVVHLRGRLAYVSFRKKNRVYWTDKLQLLADDDTITDGTYTIRTRCGNAVSYTPQAPADSSMTSNVLDTPIPESDVANAPDASPQPPTPMGPQIMTDVLAPASTAAPASASQLPPVYITVGQPSTPLYYAVSIPEPPAWGFTILALGAIAGLRLVGRFRKKGNRDAV